MKRAVAIRIAINLTLLWVSICFFIYLSIVESWVGIIFATPLTAFVIKDTFVWLKILIDVLFSKPRVILTKGLRSIDHIAADPRKGGSATPAERFYFSKIRFTDDRLKGTYYTLEPVYFKQGVELKIVYYPRSKYITQMEYSEPPSK